MLKLNNANVPRYTNVIFETFHQLRLISKILNILLTDEKKNLN